MTPSVSPETDRELTEGGVFYAREGGRELGLAFIAEFERALNFLCLHPRIGVPWRNDRRRFPLRRFPFMPFAGVKPSEQGLFRLAPRIAVKFRGLPQSQADTAVEVALSSYVASTEQAGNVLADPHLAFAFCYLAGHFSLGFMTDRAVNEVMGFLEENKVLLSNSITQVNRRTGP